MMDLRQLEVLFIRTLVSAETNEVLHELTAEQLRVQAFAWMPPTHRGGALHHMVPVLVGGPW